MTDGDFFGFINASNVFIGFLTLRAGGEGDGTLPTSMPTLQVHLLEGPSAFV